MGLVIAAGCVVNNIFDRDIDMLMDRTKNRSLVQGNISADKAFVYSIVMLLLGVVLLYKMINPLTTVIVLLGYIFYVFFYTMWYKRISVYGTLVGSISGAVPPLAGYLAVTNYINFEAVLIFLLFCLWQMPHSYAIAIFRIKDYQQANIPVLPIVKGLQKSRQHMMAYVIAFSIIATALCLFGRTGYEYLIVAIISCYMWCRAIFKNVDEENSVVWSKTVFKTSLLVVTGFSLVLGVELI